MPRLSLCLMWMDTAVYGWGLVCVVSLFTAGYSLKRLFSAGSPERSPSPGWAEDPRALSPEEGRPGPEAPLPDGPADAREQAGDDAPAASRADQVPTEGTAAAEPPAPAGPVTGDDTMAIARAALEEAFNAPAPAAAAEEPQLPAEDPESVTASIPGVEELLAAVTEPAPEPAAGTEPSTPAAVPSAMPPAAAPAAPGPAENFVRGIYEGVSGLDARLKGVETKLTKRHPGTDFAVKFLEDLAADMDNLDKAKIKARLEFLVADLKK